MEPDLAAALATDIDAAFPALVAALAGPVYTTSLRLCGPQEAEDVAQEAFTRVYKALHEYGPERRRALQLRPWVLTIALNVARNQLRATGRQVVTGTVEHRDPAPPADTGLALRQRLAAALGRLPLPTREAVVLRHIVGCPVAEVAAILDRPPGTVKAQVSRGLAALREDLEAERQLWQEER